MRLLSSILALSFCCAAVAARAQDVNTGREAARRAAVAQARGEVQAAQSRLEAAEQRVRANYAATRQMTDAQAALDQARDELERQSKPVLERLRANNPEYRAALDEEAAAAKRLADEHARLVAEDPASTQPTTQRADTPDDGIGIPQQEETLNVPVPSDEQVTAAVDKLDQRSRRRELEAEALAADPTTSPLLQEVDQAVADLKTLRTQYNADLLNDPDYRAARDALAAAKARLSQVAGGS